MFIVNTSFITCFVLIQAYLLAKIGNNLLTNAKGRNFFSFLMQFDENGIVSCVIKANIIKNSSVLPAGFKSHYYDVNNDMTIIVIRLEDSPSFVQTH